jgi:osmotically-inducible protein OsmY
VVALTGRSGGLLGPRLRETDVHICVPHERVARIQEVHLLVLHCICDGVDAQLLVNRRTDMKQVVIRTALAAVAAAALASQLTACFPLVAGGAVVTGMVATDRRTSGAQVEDEGIELRAVNRLQEAFGDKLHVNVTSYNRQVLLTGEAPMPRCARRPSRSCCASRTCAGLQRAGGGHGQLAERALHDTLLTGKVKASLVDAAI